MVVNSGLINVDLSEKNPSVFNWIEVRGVSGMGREIPGILLKEGEHELYSRGSQ